MRSAGLGWPAARSKTLSTPYHSLYWATLLTLKAPAGSIDRISQSLAGARVDLNPHQVDAALFSIRSPLSKGVILADEVGLGKTIEASLVIAQRWAERRRRVCVIVPATLRKQWQQELLDKFGILSEILESGVDLERRIAAVYQTCRSPEEIERAFNERREQLDETIQSRMAETRQALLENFDDGLRLGRYRSAGESEGRVSVVPACDRSDWRDLGLLADSARSGAAGDDVQWFHRWM